MTAPAADARDWEVTLFTPLRHQATEADCYPTCVLNALVWLFERHELPGAVLQHIYAFCLDGIERGAVGSYTSAHAAIALAQWLAEFRTRSFAVSTEVVSGHELHLHSPSKVLRALQRGSVAVLDVGVSPTETHSILALSAGTRHLEFWDPYVRGAGYAYGRDAARLDTDGHAPNLRLAKSWLDSSRARRYSLGPVAGRIGVIIQRTTRGRRRAFTRAG